MNHDDLLDHLLTLPTVYAPSLSPDGRWVAYIWYRVHKNMDVFVVPSDGSAAPLALTHTAQATRLVSWLTDSSGVIVSEDQDGDERDQLFRVDLNQPETMHPLTEAQPPYFIRGGEMHPNGRWLVYGMNFNPALAQPIEPTWIVRHDLQSGERKVLAKPSEAGWTRPRLNKAGSQILYPRNDLHPSGRQLWLVDIDGEEDRELLNLGEAVKIYANWHPIGGQVVFISEATEPGKKQDHISLGMLNPHTDEIRWLIDDPARQIEEFEVTNEGLIVVDEVIDARHRVTVLHPEGEEVARFPTLPGNLIPFGQAADGAWLATYYSADWPPEILRIQGEVSSVDDLTSLTKVWERTALSADQLASAEDFRWQSADGTPLQGWLYRAEPNPRRAILYVHGGPSAHSEERISPQLQYFVARGFNVLDVNYRGSTGFGHSFREAIKIKGWGADEQADIRAAAEALIDSDLAEAGKVGITGTSYGGYSAWWQITRTPAEIIGAAAPICGMTDLVVDYETTRPDLRGYSEEMLGGSPQDVPERYQQRSPINYVQHIQGKLLIVQGAQDPNVTPANLRQVSERLHEKDITYEELLFEDEGHGIRKPKNQRILYKALADFFERAFEAS
ncbi:MAG: S9 family peptidase [Chloroflexi bacterium]|nr:S9 family peptidase [Chloroflexota bacterium]